MRERLRLQFASGSCPSLYDSVSLDKMNQTGEMLAKANSWLMTFHPPPPTINPASGNLLLELQVSDWQAGE